MSYELTIEQRDQIMAQLSEEQRHFIHHVLVRGRRTLFARQLARVKVQFIPEDAEFEEIQAFIEEWDYQGFTDSGEVSPLTKCECGRSLRYQHKVLHVPTNTIRYFGIEHLQLHTGIDAKAVSAILKGFDVLDGEMNEVLGKYRDGWRIEHQVYLPFPEGFLVPEDIQEHLQVKLPLLGRQLIRLRAKLRELEKQNRLERIEALPKETSASYRQPFVNESSFADEDRDTADHAAFTLPGGDEPAPQQAADEPSFMADDEGQGMFLFDLFEEEAAPAPAPAALPAYVPVTEPSKANLFRLGASSQRIIDDALHRGRISARSVSEFLIEQKLASDKRMSSGKPDIYIAVAAYLDKLTFEGRCKLVDFSTEDRTYTAVYN
ncbi:DUF3895 domain-containing protein [Paenibacillus harenae]|uniref:DUF3895 domain-containing protein n=1 Tax=Paenibacillus harenae TaxID=306543 RepID=A0ABT9TYN5_PAEHA|nr:DUF3895 domain-containing protein [Paenibacillus harenae]MDQ0112485.1 hypothetical protein [Paenibacillus harenae]